MNTHWAELMCPKDGSELTAVGEVLHCDHGHRFPIVNDVPVLLRDDVDQTMDIASKSLALAWEHVGNPGRRDPDELFLESIGISELEMEWARELARDKQRDVDPVVAVVIGATSGHGYRHLVGKLDKYPIPEIRLPHGNGNRFLDIGCNWGRWSVAAATKGYRAVGIDPSLGAVLAARRVSKQLGLQVDYVCGDARYLPFKSNQFDNVFSYSVLQHFSRPNAEMALGEVARVLTPHGRCLIQMAQTFGLRSLYHQLRRRFSAAQAFDVRYWSIPELKRLFGAYFHQHEMSVHCFFGLGLEASDWQLMSAETRLLIAASEGLRAMASVISPMKYVADSIYVSASGVTTK